MTGGWAALMGAYFLGPRMGRFTSTVPGEFEGHSATLQARDRGTLVAAAAAAAAGATIAAIVPPLALLLHTERASLPHLTVGAGHVHSLVWLVRLQPRVDSWARWTLPRHGPLGSDNHALGRNRR